jgi:hypothetical protein
MVGEHRQPEGRVQGSCRIGTEDPPSEKSRSACCSMYCNSTISSGRAVRTTGPASPADTPACHLRSTTPTCEQHREVSTIRELSRATLSTNAGSNCVRLRCWAVSTAASTRGGTQGEPPPAGTGYLAVGHHIPATTLVATMSPISSSPLTVTWSPFFSEASFTVFPSAFRWVMALVFTS